MDTLDKRLLDCLLNAVTSKDPSVQQPVFVLHLNNSEYSLTDVSIVVDSPTPVNQPTSRGKAYFVDRSVCRLTCNVHDLLIVPSLTKQMLGPNTEFSNMQISAVLPSSMVYGCDTLHKNNSASDVDSTCIIRIVANLTDSVQTPSYVKLGMMIIDLNMVKH